MLADELPGSRYQLAAGVINLTGTRGSLPASREFVLPGPDGTAFRLSLPQPARTGPRSRRPAPRGAWRAAE